MKKVIKHLICQEEWSGIRKELTWEEIRELADIQTRINKLENKIDERLERAKPLLIEQKKPSK